jgi:hypothetical protein
VAGGAQVSIFSSLFYESYLIPAVLAKENSLEVGEHSIRDARVATFHVEHVDSPEVDERGNCDARLVAK